MGAVNALPGMETQPKQDGPLKEVFTGKPDGVNRIASFADHLSRHAFPLEKISSLRMKRDVRYHMTPLAHQSSAEL
jgi:hypothetical protein